MMQIGVQPLSAALVRGRPYDPDQAPGGHRGAESRPAGEAPEDAGDGILFVSPPPMPFPRVFPGL